MCHNFHIFGRFQFFFFIVLYLDDMFVMRLYSSGSTPIHAPRPLHLTSTISIGTSDIRAAMADAATQVDPQHLELSSFLNEQSFSATSSSFSRPVSTQASPSFRRFFEAETSMGGRPLACLCICKSTSTSDLVRCGTWPFAMEVFSPLSIVSHQLLTSLSDLMLPLSLILL